GVCGAGRKIAGRDTASGAPCNRDGIIVASLVTGGLVRVPATCGTLSALPQPGGKVLGRNPFFLPDGRHYLYLSRGVQASDDGIYVAAVDSSDHTRIVGANRM